MMKYFTILLLFVLTSLMTYPEVSSTTRDQIITNSPQDDSLSSVGKAINRTVDYFIKEQEADIINPQAYLLLDYLIRRYEITLSIDKEKEKRSFEKRPSNSSFSFFYKILEPTTLIKIELLDEIYDRNELSMLRPLLCKEKPVDEKFLDFIEEQINLEGYALTHAVIGLEWLKENQCGLSESRMKIIVDKAVPLLVELAKNEGYTTDLGIEAMAVLCYTGNRDKIEPLMMDKVLNAQKLDGGWGNGTLDQESNEHTTVLALWLLTSYEYPGRNPHVKWSVK